MQRKTAEFWVGLFVLAGLIALAVLAMKVGNLTSSRVQSAYTVTAPFDNIGGLNIKAPVTLAGVRIGRVSDIRINSDHYTAEVVMDIDQRYDNLPIDTSAAILTAGLLGAQYIGLEPGGDETYLKDGDQIEFTQSAIGLEQLIGQFLFSQKGGDDQ